MGSCAEPLAQLARELKCALCRQFFDQPVSLPCAHVFCSRCIRAALEGRGVFRNECPTCKLPAYVKDLSKNTKVAAVTALLRGLLEPAAGAARAAVPQPQPSCAGRGGAGGSGAGASSGDGRRKRASPDAASPRLPDGGAAGKRARGGRSSSDAPASPTPESDGRGGASGSADSEEEQSESHESHDSQVGAELLAWTAHQRSLPTPTSSECDALLEDAKKVRAAQAVIAARLRRLEQPGAGARRAAAAAAPRAHGRAGSSLRLEENGAACDDGCDSGAGPSLPLSRAGRSSQGGGSDAGPRLSVAEMRRRCLALYGRVFDAKVMRRKLAKVDPDSLHAALQAAGADAEGEGEEREEEAPDAAGEASAGGGDVAAADVAAEHAGAAAQDADADADADAVE
jgi:hypothetical protein